DHGGSADVDVFDEMAEGYAGHGRRLLEGVEVDHHHVDGLDAVGGDGGLVLFVAADVEQPAVDARVQGFNAAVQHLREACQFTNVLDRKACRTQCRGGSAR